MPCSTLHLSVRIFRTCFLLGSPADDSISRRPLSSWIITSGTFPEYLQCSLVSPAGIRCDVSSTTQYDVTTILRLQYYATTRNKQSLRSGYNMKTQRRHILGQLVTPFPMVFTRCYTSANQEEFSRGYPLHSPSTSIQPLTFAPVA